MPDQARFLGADSLHYAVEADVMRRPLWDGREGSRVDAELPAQPLDAADAGRLLPKVLACVPKPVTSLTSDRITQIQVPSTPAAGWAPY